LCRLTASIAGGTGGFAASETSLFMSMNFGFIAISSMSMSWYEFLEDVDERDDFGVNAKSSRLPELKSLLERICFEC
jgi:hypothetical protein